jgi:hypothetical protein
VLPDTVAVNAKVADVELVTAGGFDVIVVSTAGVVNVDAVVADGSDAVKPAALRDVAR